jgi:RimJ/RimL family protein N-acetyltransferase
MKIEPKEILDKQGNRILIREGRISDSEELQKCAKSYLKSKQIPLTELEFNELAKNHEEWIKKFIDGKNDLLLIAEHNGTIVGNVDLMINGRQMLKHTGYIGMGIHEDWQGQGIGTAMLKILIDWVDHNPDIEILWLQAFSNNEKGLRLYSNLGFEETCRQKGFIKTESGEYIDNVIMTRNKKTTNR